MDDNLNPISIETLIKAIQALPDLDVDLVLDAIEFLEDQNKAARTFMTLDVKFRRKWLIRKLRLQMKIVVYIIMKDDTKEVALDVLTTDTIADVKAEVQAKLGILAKQYCLSFRGRELKDSITLGDFGFEDPWRIQEFIMVRHSLPDLETRI